jgi:hypothetical protein
MFIEISTPASLPSRNEEVIIGKTLPYVANLNINTDCQKRIFRYMTIRKKNRAE